MSYLRSHLTYCYDILGVADKGPDALPRLGLSLSLTSRR